VKTPVSQFAFSNGSQLVPLQRGNGDVVGCQLDCEARTISYSTNGAALGVVGPVQLAVECS
jgi:hypothetical protein